MNEAETRAELIDPALAAAGWGVVPESRIRREFHINLGRLEGAGRRAKPLVADYILEYKNQKLASLEAKSRDKHLTEGRGQSVEYADKLQLRFAYSSNGRGVYQVNMDSGEEGEIAKFPTPEELWNATFPQKLDWRDRFTEIPFPNKSGSWNIRFYQEIAVNRVLEKVADNEQRILLTLATGTGKTSIAFQIVWKLFEAKWTLSRDAKRRPRVLFLADRNGLANQAFNDFNSFTSFDEDGLVRISPADIRKKGRVPKNGSVFFTIFQTFMSGRDENDEPAPYFGEYPPDFFDFIVIDECHRGGASDESEWRGILEYFEPAVQLGLTATPKRNENTDTYAYFGDPVYIYSLKEGINDGFLTPFRVRQITTTLDEYVYTSDDTVEDGVLEEGRVYGEKDFNRIIEIPAREKKRVEIFMELIDQREKTLVFCATQDHALGIRDYINQLKTVSKDPNYCARVTANDGEIGETYLRNFQDNEKSIPTILTTSRKLSTGVDARNVRNIVLLREIKDIIEFKQIIGRGTRLFEGKDYFTIFDFVKAHHHFSDPEWDGEPAVPDPPTPSPTRPPPPPPEPSPTDPRPPRPPRAKVILSDGKERSIQHMMVTTFWHANGTPMTAQEFVEQLYGHLPELFRNETELRELWSLPDTRKKLLEGLAEKGFGHDQLAEMQKVIDAEKSDLFDVLAHVAYALPPLTREQRASKARIVLPSHFNSSQRVFLDFVLSHYVELGVEELNTEKLSSLLQLRYRGSIADAISDLGNPQDIGVAFSGFQRYLYDDVS